MNDMEPDNPPRAIWSRLGGQLGVGLCVVGFLLVFLGWNGAASVDRVTSQFPYLLSGGVAGLCFVVLGVGMIVVQNQRADRAALQSTLREVQEALERAGVAQGTGRERPAFQRPAPRPEALAGARSPQKDEPSATSPDDTTAVAARPKPLKAAPAKRATKKTAAPRASGATKRSPRSKG